MLILHLRLSDKISVVMTQYCSYNIDAYEELVLLCWCLYNHVVLTISKISFTCYNCVKINPFNLLHLSEWKFKKMWKPAGIAKNYNYSFMLILHLCLCDKVSVLMTQYCSYNTGAYTDLVLLCWCLYDHIMLMIFNTADTIQHWCLYSINLTVLIFIWSCFLRPLANSTHPDVMWCYCVDDTELMLQYWCLYSINITVLIFIYSSDWCYCDNVYMVMLLFWWYTVLLLQYWCLYSIDITVLIFMWSCYCVDVTVLMLLCCYHCDACCRS